MPATAAIGPQPPRQSYPRYLRATTVGELALAALPGIVGLLFATTGGSIVGYRQANASRMLRADGAARFLQ